MNKAMWLVGGLLILGVGLPLVVFSQSSDTFSFANTWRLGSIKGEHCPPLGKGRKTSGHHKDFSCKNSSRVFLTIEELEPDLYAISDTHSRLKKYRGVILRPEGEALVGYGQYENDCYHQIEINPASPPKDDTGKRHTALGPWIEIRIHTDHRGQCRRHQTTFPGHLGRIHAHID